MKTVSVEVRGNGDRTLKIQWSDGGQPWPAYDVYRSSMEAAAARIRAALAALVDAALRRTLIEKPYLVKDLAVAGANLYEVLFPANDVARRVRRYYERPADFRLRFSVETSTFVPWGLVYPCSLDDAEKLAVPSDIAQPGLYDRFWCVGRELATIYDRIPPDAAGRGLNSSGLSIMRLQNSDAWERVRSRLASDAECNFVAWLDKVAPPIYSSKGLRQAWTSHGATTGLLYIYCHANSTKLALSEDEKIDSEELRRTLEGASRAADTSGCLLIINGCSTAVGDVKGDFMTAASQPGLCGFIGSETDVPDLFALRFSIALLDLLFREHLTLGEAMLRLYREHFPLSLVYGMYAHPDFSMPHAEALPPIPVPNLSTCEVGTGRLESITWR